MKTTLHNWIGSSPERFWAGLFSLHVLLRIAALYTTFLDIDESQFAGFAHVLMDGGMPYRDSLDTKPLGIYLFYANCFALFGRDAMWSVHAVAILWNFAGAFFLHKILAVLSTENRGRWAALLFVVFSTTFIPKYVATSINSIMVPFLILSVLFMAQAEAAPAKSGSFFSDALAGLVLGAAFLFKYQAGIQTVFFFLFTAPFWKFRQRSSRSVPDWILRNLIFGAGFALPYVVHGVVLARLGVWQDFYEWSIVGSGNYIVAGTETISFWWSLITRFLPYVAATFLLWSLVLAGMERLRVAIFHSNLLCLLALWFALSLIPVCLSGRFYPHYFLQILPPLCGLAAFFLVEPQRKTSRFWNRAALWGMALPALLFWILRLDYAAYLGKFPDDPLFQHRDIGLKVRGISRPEERIFVWGVATPIYFYSERSPASRYLWTDWLTGRVPGPDEGRERRGVSPTFVSGIAWEKLWEDFRKHPPVYFIDTSPAGMHGYHDFPVQNYPELARYLAENYKTVDTVEKVVIYKRKGEKTGL